MSNEEASMTMQEAWDKFTQRVIEVLRQQDARISEIEGIMKEIEPTMETLEACLLKLKKGD